VARKEQVPTVECAFCTCYHPARHTLVAGTVQDIQAERVCLQMKVF
jgi:hypothetical protein